MHAPVNVTHAPAKVTHATANGVHALHVITLVAATLSFPLSGVADWPQYRGPEGDGKSSESISDRPWSGGAPETLWKIETPLGFSSFSVAGGRATTLISRDGREVCLTVDADTGEELWSATLGESDYGHGGGNAGASDNRGGDGPRSTPAIDGRHVYVYDSHLVLSCFDAADGDLVWRRDVIEEFDGENIKWLNATSPVIDGETIYVGGGGPGKSFLAFRRDTGDLVWGRGDETITHASPRVTTIDGRTQVVYFVRSGLVGVDADSGDEIWRTPFPFSVSTAASPVTSGNLVYCSAGYGVGAGLFRLGTGRAGEVGEPDEVWFKPNELMNHWSTPIIHDGHLYGIFEFKKYGRAPLQCVNLKSGEIVWREQGFGPGNCALAGDKLVVLSDAGELAIVEATPDRYRELARADLLEGKCWSTPAVSDGRVYIRSTEEGGCFRLATE